MLVWLGASPARELRGALDGLVRLSEGWTPGAALVVAWADSGTEVLDGLPRERPEVLAVCSGSPRVRDRLAWIRAGAADLVGVTSLIPALEKRVGALPAPAPPPAPPPPAPPRAPVLPKQARKVELKEEPAAPPPPAPAPPPPPAPAPPPPAPAPPPPAPAPPPAPFAPIALPPAEPVAEAEHTLSALARYVRDRRALAALLSKGGERALLALLHERDQLVRGAAVDPYGQRAGSPPGWTVGLRPASDPGEDADLALGTVLGLGRDALTLRVDRPRAPRERLVMDVSTGEQGHWQLLLECRWQRRISAQRWLVGALILKVRRRDDAPDATGQEDAR